MVLPPLVYSLSHKPWHNKNFTFMEDLDFSMFKAPLPKESFVESKPLVDDFQDIFPVSQKL